jgi:colicin import membrane protein
VPVLTLGDLGAASGAVNPVGAYQGFIEGSIRSVWNRPEGVADLNYVAEVEVSVSAAGEIESPRLKQSSGDRRWDEAVLKAVTAARSLGRPPPAGFPDRFLVRFDVLPEAEPLL